MKPSNLATHPTPIRLRLRVLVVADVGPQKLRGRNMKQFQCKTVRYEPGFDNQSIGDDFGEGFQKVLAGHGKDGWDLKTIIREIKEQGVLTILIFGREVEANR